MKNVLKIDHKNRTLVMDRTFSKLAENTRSNEYAHLQQVRRDYPDYTVSTRQIKKNPKKETYAGLTYEYMKRYIITHEPVENRKNALAEFDEMLLVSRCHAKSKRYPVIKRWFLDKYPEIKEFGMPKEDEEDSKNTEMPATTQEKEVEFPIAG